MFENDQELHKNNSEKNDFELLPNDFVLLDLLSIH